ncbi:DASH complex subunit Dad4 [Colletotrichum asianum]
MTVLLVEAVAGKLILPQLTAYSVCSVWYLCNCPGGGQVNKRTIFTHSNERKMESPHEHQQNLLLSRIITNVEKLNEAVMVMNKSLQEINIQNMNVELVAQMFKNYQSNVLFHLEATDNLKPPS